MKRVIQVSIFTLIVLLAIFKIINGPAALILGFLFNLFFGNPFPKQLKKVLHTLLKISVIGLGFGMSVTETLRASKDGFNITAISIILTVSLGLLLLKVFGIDKKLGFLMTSGTSICGGSAIAAISPVIDAKHKTISVAIGVIFLLNAIALFVFPTLGHYFHLTQKEFGLWCAVAIHDTSSVVGAAIEYGDIALQTATTVKLARMLWIIPLSFVAIYIFKSKSHKIKIPFFILGFITTMLINSYHIIPNNFALTFTGIAKQLLVVVLFLVGMSLTVRDLKESGLKPILFSSILWIFISVFSLIFILKFQ